MNIDQFMGLIIDTYGPYENSGMEKVVRAHLSKLGEDTLDILWQKTPVNYSFKAPPHLKFFIKQLNDDKSTIQRNIEAKAICGQCLKVYGFYELNCPSCHKSSIAMPKHCPKCETEFKDATDKEIEVLKKSDSVGILYAIEKKCSKCQFPRVPIFAKIIEQ